MYGGMLVQLPDMSMTKILFFHILSFFLLTLSAKAFFTHNGIKSPHHPPTKPITKFTYRLPQDIHQQSWRTSIYSAFVSRRLYPISAIGSAVTDSSQYLVRIVFLRALAFVYGVAFLVAYRQNKALIGDHGITPAKLVLEEAEERGRLTREQRTAWMDEPSWNQHSTSTVVIHDQNDFIGTFLLRCTMSWIRRIGMTLNRNRMVQQIRELILDRTDRMDRPLTTLLWFAKDRSHLNRWLDGIALTGIATSCFVFLSGMANVPILLLLWICQRSLMAVGGPWYGYGWEPQLAELGFHALFLVPLFALNQLSELPVPKVVSWTIRWFLFRIMIGAGLIKLKSGDKKWKDLTAMNTFYETQPIPNPLSRYFHFMPRFWHKGEVLTNHFVELVAPWLLILPLHSLYLRRLAGLIQISFQFILVLSGNLSFLNWLTAVPAIMCLDDTLVGQLFFSSAHRQAALEVARTSGVVHPVRRIVTMAFGALILNLSIPVVRNLLSRKQVMNSSFDRFRLVNTYGAFGVVNEERNELIVQAATNVDGPWKEYEFKAKPGNLYRQPPWISPYHYRLDWQLWIASCGRSIERSPWLYKFLLELLCQNNEVLNLLKFNPWQDEKPKYIRIEMYQYKFHRERKQSPPFHQQQIPYWERKFVKRFYPVQGIATVETLKESIMRRPRRPPL